MFDITTLGELIIDFVPVVRDDEEITDLYRKCAGGATANITACISKLGKKTAFIGNVGADSFGRFLKDTLKRNNIDVSGISEDEDHFNALAFISHNKLKERSFEFYNKDTAEQFIDFRYIPLKLIDDCRMFHFGALTLSGDVSAEATVNCVKYAKEKGKLIAFDTNYRNHFWKDKETAFAKMREVLKYCDIVKLSDDEFQMITESDYLYKGISELFHYGIKIVLVSQGANGCIIASSKGIKQLSTYSVETVDTTGAGDSFFGAFLYKILDTGKLLEEYTIEELCDFADFANASGAICTTGYGAIPSLPTLEEIEDFRKTAKKL